MTLPDKAGLSLLGKQFDEKDMRNISRCWQYSGWHVGGLGPCFDTYEHAIKYREVVDKEGLREARRLYGLG